MFNWTASRLARLASALRAYNRAITMRARELEAAGRADLVDLLPPRMTAADVKRRVNSVNDFRRIVGYRNDAKRGRTSELTRILKSVRRDALEFTVEGGVTTTNYAKREHRYDVRAIRRRRERTMTEMTGELYPGDVAVTVGETPVGDSLVMDGNDLMPDDAGEPDPSTVDVDERTLNRWRQEDARNKRSQVTVDSMYYVYMNTWTNPLNMHRHMGRYQDMIDALEWLYRNRPDVLNKEFAKGRDELDPQYITESGGSSNPYINTPYQTRHDRAVAYVVSVAIHAGMYGNDLTGRIDFVGPVYEEELKRQTRERGYHG